VDNRRVFLVSLWLFLLCGHLNADGGFFAFENARWRQVSEKQQTCFINYNAGYENMLLAVKLDTFHSTKAAWIFPVPAGPDSVTIDVISELPEFYGRNVQELARQSIARMFSVMALSQVYPIAFMYTLRDVFPRAEHHEFEIGAIPAMGSAGGVDVYEHIEKLGLTTELITARDRDAPYAYLKAKGLDLPEKAGAILGEYVGEDYSLVVSWMSDTNRFLPDTNDEEWDWRTVKQAALSVRFPAKDIFFPLKLTRVYDRLRVPMVINVLGYVTPRLFDALRPFTKVDCNLQDRYDVGPALLSFFNDRDYVENLRYTKITIDAPAKLLTEDLRVSNSPPLRAACADRVHHLIGLLAVVGFLAASLLAGAVAATAAFREDPALRAKFTWLGLLNVATLAGVIVGAVLVRDAKTDSNLTVRPGLPTRAVRKAVYLLVFTLVFMGIGLLATALLRLLT
jgi:hypothetical protein